MTVVVILIFVILFLFYLKCTQNFNYWLEKGVKHDRPLPLVGNCLDLFLRKKNYAQLFAQMYWKYPEEKIVGFYRSGRKELVIRDPEIIKRILTTDSSYFHGRGITSPTSQKENIEPLMKNAFFTDGDYSKQLRKLIAPTFGTSKLRAMFPLVHAKAGRLQAVLAVSNTDGPKIINAKEVIARYNTDFITSVGFGLDVDTLNDEHCAFKRLTDKLFSISLISYTFKMLQELFPDACKGLKFFYKIERVFINLVKNMLKKRNYEPSGRNDFIDVMLTCKKNGAMICESTDSNGVPKFVELNDTLIAAQVFLFFAAAIDTSSTAMGVTLHQLAYHPEIQNKVQTHVDTVLAKYDNKICYEAIQEMTYLKWAFLEAIRIFPVAGKIGRECTKQYTFPDLNVTIDPGVRVSIPSMALHSDPKYFDNPEEYRPERFHPDEVGKINKFVYLPFGAGPRICLGLRLGEMQSLVGLAAVLSKFSVEPAPESVRVLQVDPISLITQIPKGGLPLIFRKRRL